LQGYCHESAQAHFGPQALKAIGQAFDEAWKEIEPGVRGSPLGAEAARLSLANIVLSLATEETKDPEPLKHAALRIFQLKRQISV
jgi:hypothetical protein